jgi:DNA invertase Pin-like site-specific DNA recombinase
MNVVGYIRVSSKGQMEGDGPTRQKQAIEKFCREHNISLTASFIEEGVSGTTEAMDRESFSQMVQFIEMTRDVSAVVVERLDRLARDLMVSEILLTELRKRGIKVFAADQGALIDMANEEGDPTRKLIRQIIAALAEWEKSSLVLKLRVARQRARAKGGTPEGGVPYGATQQEKVILELMLKWHQEGFTYARITEFLNQGDFKNRRGGKWSRQVVFGILKNRKIKNKA